MRKNLWLACLHASFRIIYSTSITRVAFPCISYPHPRNPRIKFGVNHTQAQAPAWVSHLIRPWHRPVHNIRSNAMPTHPQPCFMSQETQVSRSRIIEAPSPEVLPPCNSNSEQSIRPVMLLQSPHNLIHLLPSSIPVFSQPPLMCFWKQEKFA
jgi:hypothetical protein